MMTAIEFVNVGPEGTFEPSGGVASSPRQVDELFEHLRATGCGALTLHFHGGLVSEAYGVGVAREVAPIYRAADNHPLTFAWETGFIETFRDNLRTVHRTKLFQKVLRWVIRRTVGRFGGFGGYRLEAASREPEIEAELLEDFPFADLDDPAIRRAPAGRVLRAAGEEELEGLLAELMKEFQAVVDRDDEIEELFDQHRRQSADPGLRASSASPSIVAKLAWIAFRVIRRHARGRDHGFYPTVVEEILRELFLADLSTWAWGTSKQKAADMWRSNEGRCGEELRVGTYVLEHVARLQREQPDFVLNLVGHSAGSIPICEMLLAVAERDVDVCIQNIVFLAPAARCELALSAIGRHPERYSSFRMFTMADDYEQRDRLVKGVYNRSLLYLVSGIFEADEADAPITGMMLHASGERPYDRGPAREWGDFIKARQRLVLADSAKLDPGAPEDRRSSAVRHSDFDNDGPTRASITRLLSV